MEARAVEASVGQLFFFLDFNGTKDSLCKTRGIKCSRYCHSLCLSAGGPECGNWWLQTPECFIVSLHLAHAFQTNIGSRNSKMWGDKGSILSAITNFPLLQFREKLFYFLLLSFDELKSVLFPLSPRKNFKTKTGELKSLHQKLLMWCLSCPVILELRTAVLGT